VVLVRADEPAQPASQHRGCGGCSSFVSSRIAWLSLHTVAKCLELHSSSVAPHVLLNPVAFGAAVLAPSASSAAMLAPSASLPGGSRERGGSATALRIADAVTGELVEVDAAVEALVPVLPFSPLGCCLVALPAGADGLLPLLGWFLPPPAVAALVQFWRCRPNGIPKLVMTSSHAGVYNRP